ncbi:Clavaminate synthase-like protein [Apodospora peruviana]|uniref:Clavaminate synthase-like protein n=1 Tax=Apodospora peruviana TaxID=516989 RepID=A0AAE0M3W8_9PEZI|nr:Clavaminate synthase-like protein [Apodospora peruviana]
MDMSMKAYTGTSRYHDNLKAHCLSAAEGIRLECCGGGASSPPPAKAEQTEHASSMDRLSYCCGEPLAQLLRRQAEILLSLYDDDQQGQQQQQQQQQQIQEENRDEKQKLLLVKRLDDLMSMAYSKFYAYLFKDLPVGWRQLYTDAAILKFAVLFLSRSSRSPGVGDDEMRRGRRWIDETFTLLEGVWGTASDDSVGENEDSNHERPVKKMRLSNNSRGSRWQDTPSFSTTELFTAPVKYPVRRTGTIPLDEFQAHMARPPSKGWGSEPLVISGMVDEWPARTTHPWAKPAYLLSRTFGGRRLVPVEIGRSYVDEGWGQKIIPFGYFLREYIDNLSTSSDKQSIAYLAQHQLLTQLPGLRNDLLIPDLCYTVPPKHPTDPTQDQAELDSPQLNAWFGPPGTITPLHTDPYHNLLVQVVGRKYVRLYAPGETASMRPRGKEGGVEMGNTSLVDVGVIEGWDLPPPESESSSNEGCWEEEFRKVPYLDCILEPGDTLYIPIGWWHYVRGLSVSFSVSFWWN